MSKLIVAICPSLLGICLTVESRKIAEGYSVGSSVSHLPQNPRATHQLKLRIASLKKELKYGEDKSIGRDCAERVCSVRD